jgi:nucleoside-diphosphate-sugar epimerase
MRAACAIPGLISNQVLPGGGTTDYAVDIFYAAVKQRHYDCFLRADTQLDMMYMPDAIAAAMLLMETDAGRLTHRNGFNVTAMSFTPAQLAAAIQQHLPGFHHRLYAIDPLRQANRRFLAAAHGRQCRAGRMGLAAAL